MADNVRRFNEGLKNDEDLLARLSQIVQGYFIPESNLFGPSKFVGYKNSSASNYLRGRGRAGRVSEAALRKWFRTVGRDSAIWRDLYPRLEALLSAEGKKPNSQTTIHVPKEWSPGQ